MEEFKQMVKMGEGSNGLVYRAAGQVYKVFKKYMHSGYGIEPCTLREIALGLSMSHPNVMRFENAYMVEGSYVAVMPFVEHTLSSRKAFSEEQMLSLVRQMLSGLQYLHKRALMHRDIKPSNILYGDDGRLFITDFGLTRNWPTHSVPPTPKVGTAHYRTEEIMKGLYYSWEVDVYALGVTVLEMVARRQLTDWDKMAQQKRRDSALSIIGTNVKDSETQLKLQSLVEQCFEMASKRVAVDTLLAYFA